MEKAPKEKRSILVPVLTVALIVFAFVSGSLWQKVKNLEKGNSGNSGGTPATTSAPAANPLSIDSLKQYAKDLKLDTNKFNTCLDNSEKNDAVAKDVSLGGSEGIQGTPGFFLNGYFIGGALPFEMFKSMIDFELKTGFANSKNYPEDLKKIVDQKLITLTKKQVNLEGAPSKGPANAKITLVEYSDFECPFCVRGYSTVKQIMEAYPKDVRIIFRQFPLIQIHQNAQKAAEASLCANDQGKFWEYHDKLFASRVQ